MPQRHRPHVLLLVAVAHLAVLAVAWLTADTPLLLAGGALGSAGVVLAARWDRQRERASVSLEEAERLKRELVAVVSHEFRTPLTSIRGYARTLEVRGEHMDASTVRSCLRAIEGESRRLERIVDNVVVAGGRPLAEPQARADLDAVAQMVLDDLGAAARRVEACVTPGLAVPAAMGLVLENLLDNALKFSDPITAVQLHGRRAGDEVVIEVSNRGAPIPDDVLERVFDPFVQGDSSDSRAVAGIGLGLATVRLLVEAHGGRVQAHNDAAGVTVVVELPATRDYAERAMDPTTRRLTEFSHGAG